MNLLMENNKFIKTLLIIWQLPQLLLAWILILIWYNKHFIVEHEENNINYIYFDNISGSFTLGNYVFMCKQQYIDKIIRKHEYGHTIQSKILGPFYLIVIAIPSLIHAWIHIITKSNKSYYNFYTEKWANKLANVQIS